jgi:hypothetical protein
LDTRSKQDDRDTTLEALSGETIAATWSERMFRQLIRRLLALLSPPLNCAICHQKPAETGWHAQPFGTIHGRCAACASDDTLVKT